MVHVITSHFIGTGLQKSPQVSSPAVSPRYHLASDISSRKPLPNSPVLVVPALVEQEEDIMIR